MIGYWRRRITCLEEKVEVLQCTIGHLMVLLEVEHRGAYQHGTFHLHKTTKCSKCSQPILGTSTRQDTEHLGQCTYANYKGD